MSGEKRPWQLKMETCAENADVPMSNWIREALGEASQEFSVLADYFADMNATNEDRARDLLSS